MADVPEIARRVRDEIAARVTTPVLLWGHCAGAAPALETARLLQEAGRPAERVFVGALLLEDIGALRAEMAAGVGGGQQDPAVPAARGQRVRRARRSSSRNAPTSWAGPTDTTS
ncbi:hypothetical protein SVIOM342S_03556 [Streptomyces violaceorubidus]